MLYGANKRLLVVYQRQEEQETLGGYLVSQSEGKRYLRMTDTSIQAEITYRKNNLALPARNKALPDLPLPTHVRGTYQDAIPDALTIQPFQEGQQLGIRIVAPIYRRQTKMGFLVGDVLYTQDMIAEYAALTQTEVNFFAGTQLSIGTLHDHLNLEPEAFARAVSCEEVLHDPARLTVSPLTIAKQAYYQGRCALRDAAGPVGMIAVSLSQAIEQREVGRIVQTILTISGLSMVVGLALVSAFVAPQFTQPIITLTNAALRMARGELEQPIDVSGTDELGSLARSFAFMRAEIQEKIEELQHLNAELDQRVEERTAEVARQTYILDTFMETVPDRIYFKDRAGRITRANRAYAQQMGQSHPTEDVGKTDFDLLPPAEAWRQYQQEQAILQTGRPLLDVEEQQVWADGRTAWALTTKMPLRNEHDEIIGTFGIARDITALKHTEETLQHAKDAAEAANRAKSEFLANMNHELRTPLNVILGLTQVMTRHPHIPADERENLAIIYRSGEHLLRLINNVLDLSKIEAGRMVVHENVIDLVFLLQELRDMFTFRATQKQLALRFEGAADVPQYVVADATRLRQILINIVNNAIKFTPTGEVVMTVSATDVTPDSARLQFAIADTGPGIAPAEIGTLFEAFGQTQTGRQAQEGTGLGLTISQKFVHLMGGDITVRSVVGCGTTFTITLPVKIADAAEIPVTPTHRRVIALEPGQPRYRLLIVDDKPDNRLLLIKLLAPLGFELQEAANGQEALHVWQTCKPHLIWMDLRMPVLDGYETTRHIKATAQGQATVIIALTANSSEAERDRILTAGGDDLVQKPFQEAEIFAMLHKHLGVRYVYEGSATLELLQRKLQVSEAALTTTTLTTLPDALFDELAQAVNIADPVLMQRVIAALRPHDAALATTLEELTNQFRFDILQAVFEEYTHEYGSRA